MMSNRGVNDESMEDKGMNDIRDNGINELEYRRALKALPKELAPDRDLWAGIAARLEPRVAQPKARTPWLRYAIAAGISCAAVAFAWRGLPMISTADNQVAVEQSPWVLREAEQLKADVDAALTIRDGVETILVSAHGDRALSASLKELDSAESELDQALRLNPDSTFLLDRMRHVQQQKSRLTLRSLAA